MTVSRDTHTLHIMRESRGIAICQIVRDEDGDDRYYVVAIDRRSGQVYDAIPNDGPDSGHWFAGISVSGVAYVASPRTRQTATRWYRRLIAE